MGRGEYMIRSVSESQRVEEREGEGRGMKSGREGLEERGKVGTERGGAGWGSISYLLTF